MGFFSLGSRCDIVEVLVELGGRATGARQTFQAASAVNGFFGRHLPLESKVCLSFSLQLPAHYGQNFQLLSNNYEGFLSSRNPKIFNIIQWNDGTMV